MNKCFAGGHLRYVDGAWRDDNGYAVDIEPVRHGEWVHTDKAASWKSKDECGECHYHTADRIDLSCFNYCPNCGAKMKMDGGEKE